MENAKRMKAIYIFSMIGSIVLYVPLLWLPKLGNGIALIYVALVTVVMLIVELCVRRKIHKALRDLLYDGGGFELEYVANEVLKDLWWTRSVVSSLTLKTISALFLKVSIDPHLVSSSLDGSLRKIQSIVIERLKDDTLEGNSLLRMYDSNRMFKE